MTTKQIVKAISLASPAKSTLPILESVLLKDGTLTATDLDLVVVLPFRKTETVCLPARRFMKILERMPDFEMSLGKDNKTTFSQNDECITLTGEGPNNFPAPKQGETKVLGFLSHLDFATIKAASDFVTEDELRPAMMHVLISDEIVGTNGHILYFKKAQSSLDAPILMLPKTFKVMEVFGGCGWTVSKDTDGWLRLVNQEGVIIHQRVSAEDYPNYKKVMPKETHISADVNRKDLIQAVERAREYTSATTKQVEISFSKDQLIVRSQDVDFGSEYSKLIPTRNHAGDQIIIGFNADYLVDLLKVLRDETMTVRMETPHKPTIWNDTMLLMPVRLNQ